MICCENVVDVKFLKNEKLNYIKKKKKKNILTQICQHFQYLTLKLKMFLFR